MHIYLDDTAVWKELEKENKEFFESYAKSREARGSDMETRENFQNMLSDSSKRDTSES